MVLHPNHTLSTHVTATKDSTQMPGTDVSKIRLPPLEVRWRWPRHVNPYLDDIEQECLEWSASFGAFDPETQKLIHEHGKLSMSLEYGHSKGVLTRECRPLSSHVLCTHAAG